MLKVMGCSALINKCDWGGWSVSVMYCTRRKITKEEREGGREGGREDGRGKGSVREGGRQRWEEGMEEVKKKQGMRSAEGKEVEGSRTKEGKGNEERPVKGGETRRGEIKDGNEGGMQACKVFVSGTVS